MLLLGQECRHNKCQLHHEAGKTHIAARKAFMDKHWYCWPLRWGMTTVSLQVLQNLTWASMMAPMETHISLKWISILENSLVWKIFLLILWPLSWVVENGFTKQSAVSHIVGRKTSCSSPHLTGPSLWRGFLPSAMTFRLYGFIWHPPVFHTFLHSFTIFMCVYAGGGALICVCAHKHVGACTCGSLRLIIKSQLWPILHLIHWGRISHPTQGLPLNPGPPTQPGFLKLTQGLTSNPGSLKLTPRLTPNPGSLILTQGLSTQPRVYQPNPSLGDIASLIIQIVLGLLSLPFLRLDLQAGLQTQCSYGFSGSKLWLSCSLCKHASKWAVSSTPRTLIWNFNIYPFRQHRQGFRWLWL